jgi:hypothetical protein
MSKIVPVGARLSGVSHHKVFSIPIFQVSINRLCRIAARTFGVPASCMALVDMNDRIHIEAAYGIDRPPEALSYNPLLSRAIKSDLFVVEDIRQISGGTMTIEVMKNGGKVVWVHIPSTKGATLF